MEDLSLRCGRFIGVAVFVLCAADGLASPRPDARSRLEGARLESDLDELRRVEAELRRALVEVSSARALFAKASDHVQFLTRDEQAELLRRWQRYYVAFTAVDRVARTYFQEVPSPIAPGGEGVGFEAYLLGNLARAIKLIHGTAFAEIAPDSSALAARLNGGIGHPAPLRGSYDRFRVGLVDKLELGRLLRFCRYEARRVFLHYADLADGSIDPERWMLRFWQRNRAAVELLLQLDGEGRDLIAAALAVPALERYGSFRGPVVKEVAQFLGRTRVETRTRPLIRLSQVRTMLAQLEPGDLILEKKTGYLCNLAIRGFWGHSAIYIGSYEEAQAYFDTEEVKAYFRELGFDGFMEFVEQRSPEAIALWRDDDHLGGAPVRVLEGDGLARSIVLRSAEQSLASDYVAALRPLQPGRLDKARAIADALSYWNTPYDFGFDVHSDDALVCTELIAKAYAGGGDKRGLRLPVERTLDGPYMIYPSAIAELITEPVEGEARQLELVYFLRGIEGEGRAEVGGADEFAATTARITLF